MATKTISKSSFISGLDCHLKLWNLLWNRDKEGQRAGIDELRMQFGIRFGQLAHVLYPDAVLIAIDKAHLEQAEAETRKAIEAGATHILEATFRHEQCRAISDVVIRQEDGSWHLVEVKSTTDVEPKHYPDLAFQRWIMERCGYRVSRCSVVFSDKKGRWPHERSIFQSKDVTDRVDLALQEVPDQLAPMIEIARSENARPEFMDCVTKGCHKCEFKQTVCWTDITEPTIYDLVDARKIPLLRAEGVFYAKDIPPSFELNNTNRRNVNCVNAKATHIEKPAITSLLSQLEYPIHFLDFESIAVATPLFDGNWPWQRLPIQYSIHRLDAEGTLAHCEFLHQEYSDPSVPLIEQLLKDIGDAGSVVVYHKTMESGVLNDLARWYPQYATALLAVDQRIWDLEVVFRDYYRDWRFGSRSSIKVVLPALVPELDHADEAISDGGEASLSWIEMLETDDDAVREKKKQDLFSYCRLDTYAMVKLLAHVREVVNVD